DAILGAFVELATWQLIKLCQDVGAWLCATSAAGLLHAVGLGNFGDKEPLDATANFGAPFQAGVDYDINVVYSNARLSYVCSEDNFTIRIVCKCALLLLGFKLTVEWNDRNVGFGGALLDNL